jgi:hypothetical protein
MASYLRLLAILRCESAGLPPTIFGHQHLLKFLKV